MTNTYWWVREWRLRQDIFYWGGWQFVTYVAVPSRYYTNTAGMV